MFKRHCQPGLFIVVEGTDGAGTTSITNAITTALWRRLGLHPAQTSEPTDPEGVIGSLIRDMLNKKAFTTSATTTPTPHADLEHFGTILRLLFAADRFDHIDRTVMPVLKEGRPMVCDRYVYSSMVYQGRWPEQEDDERDFMMLPFQWELVTQSNEGIIEPDMVLFLDVDPEVAFERINRRNKQQMAVYEERDVFETRDKVTKHTLTYKRLFRLLHDAEFHQHAKVRTVDANAPFDDVFESCMEHVESLF
jgi:dTMP kinase